MSLLLAFIHATADTLQPHRQVFWKDGNVPGQILYREEEHIQSMIDLMGEIALYRTSTDPLKKEVAQFLQDIFFVLPGESFQPTGWFGTTAHKKPIQLWSWIKAQHTSSAICSELRDLLTRTLTRDAENNWTNPYVRWFCALPYEEEKHLGRTFELADLLHKLQSSPTLSPSTTPPPERDESWDHLESPQLDGKKFLKEPGSGRSSNGQSSSQSDLDDTARTTLAPPPPLPPATDGATVDSAAKAKKKKKEASAAAATTTPAPTSQGAPVPPKDPKLAAEPLK
jgi:hypothetical protein